MPHVLIAGITESGKTTLGVQLAKGYQAKDVKTIVLDPLNDPRWQADYQTTDPELFVYMVKNSRQCAVFIDESGEMIGQYNKEMFFLATRARHYGHNCHFLTQRVVQLAKTVRDQCQRLFLFAVSIDDAKILANEWNKPLLKECNILSQFECYYCSRFGEAKKIKIIP